LEEKERVCESERVEAIFRGLVTELEMELEKKQSELGDCKKVEKTLRGQVNHLKKTILELDSDRAKRKTLSPVTLRNKKIRENKQMIVMKKLCADNLRVFKLKIVLRRQQEDQLKL
jgi:hypothetical protein